MSPKTIENAIGEDVALVRRSIVGSEPVKGTLALVDQATVSGASFLTSVIVGRTCGLDELGVYCLGFSLAMLVVSVQESLVSTPFTVYAQRLDGASRARYAGSALVQHAALAALAAALLAAVGTVLWLIGRPAWLGPLFWILAVAAPPVLLRDLVRRFAFARMRMAGALALDLTVSAVQVGAMLVLAAVGFLSAGWALVTLGAACGLAGMVWLLRTRSDCAVSWKEVPEAIRRNWSFGRWVFAALMMLMLQGSAVPWLLALLIGTGAAGLFAACMNVVLFANPFVLGLSNVLVPATARAVTKGGATGVRDLVWKTTGLVGAAMAVFCAAVFLAGDAVLDFLYLPEGGSHAALLIVLALALSARALGMAAYNGLQALDRPQMNFLVNGVALTVTVASAVAGMFLGGVLGAALGYLAGDVVGMVFRLIAFTRAARVFDSIARAA